MTMGPLLSWAVVLSVLGAAYYVSQRKKPVTAVGKKHEPLLQEKKGGKPVFIGGAAAVGSGNDTPDPKKKSKKKPKKTALSSAAPPSKGVASTDDGGNKSDDEVAEEVDLRDVARRMKASSARRGGQATTGIQYAGSQTSSTGADGDIDEEDNFAKGSSTDPSDMLEAPTSGPGVLRIGAPAQLPRAQKKKATPSSSSEPGIHATKNAKNREQKKAQREAERVEQQARFEQHRKSIRAEEAAQQQQLRPAPAVTPASSAWTQSGGKKAMDAPASAATAATVSDSSSALLDTFTPTDSSDERTLQQSTTLGDSWESIPPSAMVPEQQWNQVKSKKGRKDRKGGEDSDAAVTAEESKPRGKAVAPAPEIFKTPVPPAPKAPAQVHRKKVLESGRTSGSDWAEIDNVENWLVHPESSDY